MKYAQSIKTAILFSAFLILGLAFTPAHAAEQVVTLTTDNDVAGDGEEGDLRYAIANVGDGESITFNISGSDTVTLKAELNISDSGTNPLGAKNITINGINQYTGNAVTVQVETPGEGGSAFRVFKINASGKTVSISNMIVKGGDIASNGNVAAGYGGGVYASAGTVIFNSVQVDGSRAYNGGGINIETGATAQFENSLIWGNKASMTGDGICNEGTLTLQNSTVAENGTAGLSGFPGIFSDGPCVMVNSTVTANNGKDSAPIATGRAFCNYLNGKSYVLNSIIAGNNTSFDIDNQNLSAHTLNAYYTWYDSPSGTINGSNNTTAAYTSSDLGALAYNGGFTNTSEVASAANNSTKAGSGAYAYYNSTDRYYFYNGSNYTKISDGSSFDPSDPGSDKILTDQRGYYRTSGSITAARTSNGGIVAKIGTGTSWTGGTDTYTTIKGAYDAALGGSTVVLAGTAILESGIDLDASKSITLQGADAGTTCVQAAKTPGTASDRVFNITAGTIALMDMTIQNGNVSGDGGGIYIGASAELTINDCVVRGNTATSSSYGYGGGIFAKGSTTLANCTVSGNRAVGPTAEGGGIVAAAGSGSAITLTNCTISGNEAVDNAEYGAYGGGISIIGDAGAALLNCTISGNAVTSVDAYGAGVMLYLGTANVKNTIIAQNSDNANAKDYVYGGGTLNDQGYNVVEYQDLSATTPNDNKSFNVTTDILYNTIVGTDTIGHGHWNQNGSDFDGSLNLSSTLALNGSFNGTYTLALGEGSFAAGSESGNGIPPDDSWNGSPAADQRGVVRTADQNTSIGAYSANYVPSTVYYMAKATGDWSAYETVWSTTTTESTDPNDYNTQAIQAPDAGNSAGIIINDDIDVTVVTGGFSIDQVTVDTGASIVINSGQTVTLADGSGDGLTVDGTGTVDVNGTLDASSARVVYTGAGALNLVQDSFSVNAFISGSSTVTLDGGVAQTIGSAMVFNNLTLAEDTVLTTANNITVSGETSGTGTVNASNGTFTCNRGGDQTLFGGTYDNLTTSGSGTKTLSGASTVNNTLTIDNGVTLDVNGSDPLTVKNLTVTNGTMDVSGLNGNLLVGGNLQIGASGAWIKHANSDYCVQFTGAACTFLDQSAGQNLGHVKVDE